MKSVTSRMLESPRALAPSIRSLVGMGRGAVADAFSDFRNDQAASADQIGFIGMVIEHLTGKGVMARGCSTKAPLSM